MGVKSKPITKIAQTIRKFTKKKEEVERPKGVQQRLATDLPKEKPKNKTRGDKSYEREASRMDPDSKGSVNVGRGIEYDVSQGRMKMANAKPLTFLELQRTKGSQQRAEIKAALERIINNKKIPKKDRDKAKATFEKMEKADEARATTRNIRASQTLRKDKKVTLPGGEKIQGLSYKQKGTKYEFYDKNGEVHEIAASRFDKMTPNEKQAFVRDIKKRAEFVNIDADVRRSNALDAKYKQKRSQGSRTVKGHTPRGEELKKGGKVTKKKARRKTRGSVKPRGCGVAKRGFGKAMMCGGRVKGKK